MRYNSAVPPSPPTGRLLCDGDPGFDGALHDAVWNARKPPRRPARILIAAGEDDVSWGVRHAAELGLRVGVRSGGHSWYGNGVREGEMLIDLSRLRDVSIDPRQRIAAVGPGLHGRDLDRVLLEHGLFFPIGHCGSVGLGGFILGGGYGWNSRAVGPACLSVRAIDAVLADGRIVHADDASDPDLMWAARGAGPGFCGVVTRLHLALVPRPAIARLTDVYPLELHDELIAWAFGLLADLPAELEVSVRVGHSEVAGTEALTLTGMAFAEPGGDPDAMLEPLRGGPFADRRLGRIDVRLTALPDLHDRGAEDQRSRWDVDGIWTRASAGQIIPAARAAGLGRTPGGESFVLWMLWGHHPVRDDACWSIQAPLYLSPNAGWSDPSDDAPCRAWVDDAMRALARLSCGVQFSDSDLAARPGQGLSAHNAERLEAVRDRYDPDRRLCSYLTPAEIDPRSRAVAEV
jgi:FAD/FMN-containing dehydrogenase